MLQPGVREEIVQLLCELPCNVQEAWLLLAIAAWLLQLGYCSLAIAAWLLQLGYFSLAIAAWLFQRGYCSFATTLHDVEVFHYILRVLAES